MMRFRLLGPLEVVTGRDVSRPVGRHQRVLLTALLLEPGRTWSTDRLMDLLWRDQLPDDPGAALRSQVSRLRRTLGAAAVHIATDSRGYRLRDLEADDVDHLLFQRLCDRGANLAGADALECLDAALALWRGGVCEGLEDVVPFQSFVAALGELHVGARWRRADLLRDLGRLDQATGELTVLIEDARDHEGARASLARSLYSGGRAPEALRVVARWRKHLAEEYGLDPSPEIRSLEQKLLAHSLDLRGPDVDHSEGESADSLLGRSVDLARGTELCAPGVVTTLIGTGGVGKTRLAREIARRIDRDVTRVTFVDVSTVTRAGDVVRAIAQAFAIEDRPKRRLVDVVAGALSTARGTLVMDSCEHHLEATASLLDTFVDHGTRLKILATSRERLGVGGERVWSVEPLATHPGGPAVELFIRRFCAANPTRDVTRDDLTLVAEICERLDGLPLAIELAAVATRAFSLVELADRLDQRFTILVGGPRHRNRHRSLRAMVDSSYEALDLEARSMLNQLAVFVGDFDIEAALAVCPEDASTLLALVDCSLLASRRTTPTRFAMLDTIRAYGLERLSEAGSLNEARRRHAHWALRLARQMERAISTSDEADVAARVASHFGELRAAHAFLVGDDPAAAIELSAALRSYALTRATSELYRWADVAVAGAVAAPTRPRELAAAWNMVTAGAWRRGDLAAADDAARATILAAVDEVDRRHGWEATAELALLRGDPDAAVHWYIAAAEMADRTGDRFSVVWDVGGAALAEHYARPGSVRAEALRQRAATEAASVPSPSAQAFGHFLHGEFEARTSPTDAEGHLRTAIDIARDAGSTFISGLAEVALAALLSERPDPTAALDLYETVIQRWHADGVWSSQWITLRSLTGLLVRCGQWDRAAALWGAEATRDAGTPAYGRDAETLALVRADLQAQLGEEAFRLVAHQGRDLSDTALIEHALHSIRTARASMPATNVGRTGATTISRSDPASPATRRCH